MFDVPAEEITRCDSILEIGVSTTVNGDCMQCDISYLLCRHLYYLLPCIFLTGIFDLDFLLLDVFFFCILSSFFILDKFVDFAIVAQ